MISNKLFDIKYDLEYIKRNNLIWIFIYIIKYDGRIFWAVLGIEYGFPIRLIYIYIYY